MLERAPVLRREPWPVSACRLTLSGPTSSLPSSDGPASTRPSSRQPSRGCCRPLTCRRLGRSCWRSRAMSQTDVEAWTSDAAVRLVNAYGPFECTTLALNNPAVRQDRPGGPRNIGRACGSSAWVSIPTTTTALCPSAARASFEGTSRLQPKDEEEEEEGDDVAPQTTTTTVRSCRNRSSSSPRHLIATMTRSLSGPTRRATWSTTASTAPSPTKAAKTARSIRGQWLELIGTARPSITATLRGYAPRYPPSSIPR